jgi:hypothetical protein
MGKFKKEAEVKTVIGNWLKKNGCEVYDERGSSTRPHWDGYFQVENIGRARKPDLVIGCYLSEAGQAVNRAQVNYVGLEIKPGYEHKKIAEGFGDVLGYFADYCCGATYFIKPRKRHRKQVAISVLALATNFSSQGFLYEEERKFGRKQIGETRKKRKFYPMTFSLSRLLGAQKTVIQNNVMNIVGIPGAKNRFKRGLTSREDHPQVGILVKYPPNSRGLLMMTSESPYYWDIIGI